MILKHVILLSVVVIGAYLIGKIPYLIQKNILTSGDPAVGRQIRFVVESPSPVCEDILSDIMEPKEFLHFHKHWSVWTVG